MFEFIDFQYEPSDNQIRFAFSLHKCGSSLLNEMVKDVCRLESIANVNIPDPMFQNGILDNEWQLASELPNFIKPGYLYHSFRAMPPIFRGAIDFSNCKSILLLRDPRDAMVSQYFSFKPGGSHAVPEKNVEKYAEGIAQDMGITIDEYAKKYIHQHKNRLEFYSDTLDMEKTRVYKYEDIYFDKFSFLKSIFDYWGYKVSEQTIENVVKKRDIRPDKEDPTQHIRKGTPGDHIEKLERSTIEYINDVMRPISSRFGYDL